MQPAACSRDRIRGRLDRRRIVEESVGAAIGELGQRVASRATSRTHRPTAERQLDRSGDARRISRQARCTEAPSRRIAWQPLSLRKTWSNFGSSSRRTCPNQELRNRLVEIYLPLVKYNGERIWARLPEGVELDDLISAGVFGLMDAIDAFDLSRGVKFETYCVPRIRGAMLDELRTMDWVPRLVRSKASKLNEAIKNARSPAGPPAHRDRAGRAAWASPCPSWRR